MDVEKIEAGKMDFQFKVVDINTLVNESVTANKMFAEKFSITIKITKTVENIKVNVDASRLMQVMANLISNAVKFSKPNMEIDIAITQQNDKVRIAIRDQGAGIPLEFQSRIFERFSQADSSDTRSKSGTGLGLKY